MRVCPNCNRLYGPKQQTCKVDGAATQDHVQVLIGRSLGPYQVESVIGEGGMGVVYLGEHPTIGRKVALKVLRPELSLRDILVERFIQEARSVNTIGHDNIVNIYDFGKTPFGSFYIVMEHLDGQDMRSLLEQEGPQPLKRVRVMLRCIGAALAAAHAKGFIHRDVKPENIMLIRRLGKEHAKLLDFGIVKLLSAQSVFETQVDAAPLGTAQYMSPEQLEQSELDHRADIFSLAAVLYELITGQLPFPGKTPVEVRQLQLNRAPTAPSVLREDIYISRRLDAALLWALSPNPEDRCGRVVDLISAFEEGYQECLAGPPPGEHAFDDMTDLTAPHYPPRRPRPMMLWVLGLLVLLCGLGSVGYLVLGEKKGSPIRHSAVIPDLSLAAPADATAKPALATEANLAIRSGKMVAQALDSEDPGRRALVIKLIGRTGSPLQLPRLEAALKDKDPGVRRAAALTLGQLGSKTSAPALGRALARSVGYASVDIAQALAQLGKPSGARRLGQEMKQARDDFRRKYVLHAMGRVGDPGARGWWRFLKGQRLINARLRITALGYLAAAGDAKARAELEEATAAGGWNTRVQAAAAMWRIKEGVARRVLMDALDQAAPQQKAEAAAALARLGVPEAGETLVKFLGKSGVKLSPALRSECALALGYLQGEDSGQALAKALTDTDEDVALAAAVAYLGHKQLQD